MRSLFGVAISLLALATFGTVLWRRQFVVRLMGGTTPFLAMTTLAVGGNATLVVLPSDGPRSQALVLVAGAFVALASLTTSWTSVPGGVDRRQRNAWWTLGALLAWCFFADAFVAGGIYGSARWFTYAAALAIWVGVGALASRAPMTPAGFAYLSAIVLSVMTLPAAVDDAAWGPCATGTFEKCSPAGALYRSFAVSENYIAILAAFALVAALTSLRGRDRAVIATHAAVTLVASGSRTGALSVGATLGVVILLRVLYQRGTKRTNAAAPRTAPVLGLALAVAAMGAVAVRLVLTASPEAFSRRGAIWGAVRAPLDEHPATGVGLSKWTYYQEFGDSPQHFFHSAYAMLLFAGGFVGCALFCSWLFWIMAAASRGSYFLPVFALTTLLAVYSATEVVWNPLAIDGLTWIAVGLSCIGTARFCNGQRGPVAPGAESVVSTPQASEGRGR